jgi:hypothetical protein
VDDDILLMGFAAGAGAVLAIKFLGMKGIDDAATVFAFG